MEPAAASDEALLQQYAAGSAAAFETLYRRHEMKVWRFIRRQVGDQAVADELMQEVWFAVAREAGRYGPLRASPPGCTRWRAIASSTTCACAANMPASMRRGPMASHGSSRWPAAENAEPFPQLLSDESLQRLLAAVERLPQEQREAFLLQVEGELSVEEIATLTGVGFETVKSRLRYARARLRNELAEYA